MIHQPKCDRNSDFPVGEKTTQSITILRMATVFPDFEKLEMNSMETTEKNGTWHNYTGYA